MYPPMPDAHRRSFEKIAGVFDSARHANPGAFADYGYAQKHSAGRVKHPVILTRKDRFRFMYPPIMITRATQRVFSAKKRFADLPGQQNHHEPFRKNSFLEQVAIDKMGGYRPQATLFIHPIPHLNTESGRKMGLS